MASREILFVCMGNTCRSPMAEAITGHLIDERSLPVRVGSAGLRAGESIAPEAVVALRNRGIVPARQDAVQLTKDMVDDAVLVLCATEEHRRVLVEAVPECAGRAFVWGDFVSRAQRAVRRPAPRPGPRGLEGLVAELAHQPGEPGHDLADPIGKGQRAYDEAAAAIERLARGTVDLLQGDLGH